jgi:DNA-binding MarR family transcriptional regulator
MNVSIIYLYSIVEANDWCFLEEDREKGCLMQQEPPTQGQFSVLLVHLYREMVYTLEQHIGMSQSRLELLHEVWHEDGIHQKAIGHRLGIEGAAITRFVKDMEATGLITRRVDPQDNRFTLVSIAPEGLRVLQEGRKHRYELEAQMLEGLSQEEQVQLMRMLLHVQQNLPQRNRRSGYQAHEKAPRF